MIISILYNRGVYAEESFAKVKKYGLPMLLTQDEGVKTFIANLTAQLSGSLFFFFQSILWVANLSIDFGEFDAIFWNIEWLEAGKLQRVVLVIMSKATNEVLERWNFSIETDSEVVEKG